MNTKIYEGVEYGTLDQAVLQEYIAIDALLQQPRDNNTVYDFDEDEDLKQTYSRSLVGQADDYDIFDKEGVLLNKTGKTGKLSRSTAENSSV